MNFLGIIHILGWIFNFEAIFMTLPCIVALIYGESSGFSFLITIGICLFFGIPATLIKYKRKEVYARDGFIAVSISWILLSIVGALPFVFSGAIPSYIDALFETISGFTTTGASILSDVESLPRCIIFWRSFTHWIGGMGVLVFIMAILPLAGGQNMHLLRAESPGPQVGKLVPRLRSTAKILYGIYILLTLLEIIFLVCGGMPVFDTLTTTFGTVGTGGFGIKNASIAGYSTYIGTVVTIFMLLSGINFNVFYLFLIGKPKNALKCEEMWYYLGIVALSIILITFNIRGNFESLSETIYQSSFQVASVITTTGYSTVDFNTWPSFSKTILWLLMFVGACAGSTGGGIKVSRFIIMLKSIKRELGTLIHPRIVKKVRLEGKPLETGLRATVAIFMGAYFIIFFLSILIISFEGFDFETNVTAVTATLNNIGPGFGMVGASGNFGFFSPFSKIILMFDMLAGRLELFPLLLLFSPSSWKKQ